MLDILHLIEFLSRRFLYCSPALIT